MLTSEMGVGGCKYVRDVTDGVCGTLRGIVHLPDIQLTSIDVFERILVLLFDRILQIIDRAISCDLNPKDTVDGGSENRTVELPSVSHRVSGSTAVSRAKQVKTSDYTADSGIKENRDLEQIAGNSGFLLV